MVRSGIHPSWRSTAAAVALLLGGALSAAAQPGPSAKPESDWSRLIGEFLPAIQACIGQPAVPVESVLKAWPMTRGLVGVRLRSTDGHRFDCMAPLAGGAAERLTGLMPEDGAAPGEGDPVFLPKHDTPPPLRVDQLERVVDGNGVVRGWLSYASGGPNDPVSRIAGTWRLAELGGRGGGDTPKPSLTFAADGTLRGEGGCNRIDGSFTLIGDAMKFAKLATAKRACAKTAMTLERRFVDALRRVARWRIESERLVLSDDKGGVSMRLSPEPP